VKKEESKRRVRKQEKKVAKKIKIIEK